MTGPAPRIDGEKLATGLRRCGFDFFTGVPCSLLARVWGALADVLVPAAREDEAVGMAAGAWLAGRRPVVLMQNSGLGTALNALASLTALYEMPLLLLVGWRGASSDDAPEHLLMGRHTPMLLEAVGAVHEPVDASRWNDQLQAAAAAITRRRIAALTMREGTIA